MKTVIRSRVSLLPTVFILLLLCLPAIAQNDDTDDDVLRVDADLVVLNAAVLDPKGMPVLGLKQKNFTVLEDGVEQKVDFFEAEQAPFAAVILIDTSGSMESRVSLARSATINFLDGLRLDDMAAIYKFDSEVKLIQDFSQSRDVPESIYELQARGMTLMYDAIYQAVLDLAKRPEKRKAILVLSDGQDTQSRRSSDKALKMAIAANITIFTVDMSSINDLSKQKMQNLDVLRNFAEKSGGRFFTALGGLSLKNALSSVVKELGTQYTLGYSPSNNKKDGKYRKIELKVTDPKATVRTRKGYHALKK